MPISPVSAITRRSTRRNNERLNILCAPTHERFEVGLAQTNCNFYAFQHDSFKGWTVDYAPVPDNYFLLDKRLGAKQIPLDLDFDLVLSQNKFGQFQVLSQVASQLGLPLVSLEHTLPVPNWDEKLRNDLANMRGDINVFISDYSIAQWRFDKTPDVRVIKHCVDSELFKPATTYGNISGRQNHILSVVNDYIGRRWCCGFDIWERVTKGLPVHPVGDTAGFSEKTKTVAELVEKYQNSRIFINTSTISPIPTALLEAMSCGCAIISTATCMIPEVIEDGVNGFLTNDEDEMRERLELLLKDEDLAIELGKKARETIKTKFAKNRFISEWQEVLEEAANIGV